MTGSAVSLAAAVLLALTAPTAVAVAFFIAPAAAVAFLLGVAAMGSSTADAVAFLRGVVGWADATPVGGRVTTTAVATSVRHCRISGRADAIYCRYAEY
jgi:hypothetical protein